MSLTVLRAYPLASLGHAAWILRHFGYKAVFIWGLFLYGMYPVCSLLGLRTNKP